MARTHLTWSLHPRTAGEPDGRVRMSRGIPPGESRYSSALVSRWPRHSLSVLTVLAVARAVLAFFPSMGLWGLNFGRFLPASATIAALASCILLIALLASPLPDALASGLAPSTRRQAAWAGAFTIGFSLAMLFPDRSAFLGDSLLRLASARIGSESLFPQISPGDLIWHLRVPHAIAAASGIPIETVLRLQGALVSGFYWLAAWRLARWIHPTPCGRLSILFALGSTGLLLCCTGYSKGLQTSALFGFLFLSSALRGPFPGRIRSLTPELFIALALAMHRSSVLFLPAHLLSLSHIGASPWQHIRTRRIVASLVWLSIGVRDLVTIISFDLGSSTTILGVSNGLGATLRGAADPLRLMDWGNGVLTMAPLAVLLPLAWPQVRRAPQARLTVAAITPWIVATLLAPPLTGWFRYMDGLAPLGPLAAIAASLACASGLSVDGRATRRALAVLGVGLGFFPVLLPLMVNRSDSLASARVVAYATEAPMRPAIERTEIWEFLAMKAASRGQLDDAASHYRLAAEATPAYRRFVQWGLSSAASGDWPQAAIAFAHADSSLPGTAVVAAGLAASAYALGDSAGFADALDRRRVIRQLPEQEVAWHSVRIAFPSLAGAMLHVDSVLRVQP